jgi:hypothetical protein
VIAASARTFPVSYWERSTEALQAEERSCRRKPRGSLARLQRHLFNESEHAEDHVVDDQVQVFSAPGEGRECVDIARRVLAQAKNGVPFDRMAVLLRAPETYRIYLEEAFGRAGVPAHFARGAVRPDPAGRHSTRCFVVLPRVCRPAASPNTCPSVRFLMPPLMVGHRHRRRLAIAGSLKMIDVGCHGLNL